MRVFKRKCKSNVNILSGVDYSVQLYLMGLNGQNWEKNVDTKITYVVIGYN